MYGVWEDTYTPTQQGNQMTQTLEQQYREALKFDQVFKTDLDSLGRMLAKAKEDVEALNEKEEQDSTLMTSEEYDYLLDCEIFVRDNEELHAFLITPEALDYRWDTYWNVVVNHVTEEKIESHINMLKLLQEDNWDLIGQEFDTNWQEFINFKVKGELDA